MSRAALAAGAFAAAIALAIGADLFVLGVAEANPSAPAMLATIQRFVGSAQSVDYTLAIAISEPATTPGGTVSYALTGHGVALLGRTDDVQFSQPTGTVEIADPGPSMRTQGGQWQRVASSTDAAAALVAGGGQAAAMAVLLARAETARGLLATAAARRAGQHAHLLELTSDPSAVGAAVLTGSIDVDATGRPRRLQWTASGGPATVAVTYEFRSWNQPVDVPAPAPAG